MDMAIMGLSMKCFAIDHIMGEGTRIGSEQVKFFKMAGFFKSNH